MGLVLRFAVVSVFLSAGAMLACDSDSAASLPEGCDALVEAGVATDDAEALQQALLDATSGQTVCLAPGTFAITRSLSVATTQNLTIRGTGDTRDAVVLDFATQAVGANGMDVTADGFTIENLTIKNSAGNGIEVVADDPTFRNILVTWDAGPVTENGAYAVYPTKCAKALIENVEVSNAADAGIYVGSCQYAIVRDNVVTANVAGIEIENSSFADVNNNTVTDNTFGIAVFALPNLAIKEVTNVLVRGNTVTANNRANFAEPGSVVSFVPSGVGLVAMGAKDLEIRDNTFTNNQSTASLLVGFNIFKTLSGSTANDPGLDPYIERVYIHDNTYSGNGAAPTGALIAVAAPPLENVLWDGDWRTDAATSQICLGATPTTFRQFAGQDNFDAAKQYTDTTDHACSLTALPEMVNFDGVVVQ